MTLFWRVFSAIGAVVALCLFILFTLATVQYDAILSGLVRDRVSVIAQVLSEPFKAASELGLSVDTLRNVDDLLRRTKGSAPDVLGIYLFDATGTIVRSTEPSLSETLIESAKTALSSADGATWFGESEEGLLVASFVNGPDGKIAGGVLISHGDEGRVLQLEALVGKLAFAASGVFALSLLIGIGVLRYTLRGHIRIFDAVLATYDRFERQSWRGFRPDDASAEALRGFGIDTDHLFELLEKSEERYQAVNPSRLPAPAAARPYES